MYLTEKLEKILEHVNRLQEECGGLDEAIKDAKEAWPDNQIVPGIEWYDRTTTPPKGRIWASDGLNVWIISSDGNPIPETATAVKFWTNALIPAAPTFIKAK